MFTGSFRFVKLLRQTVTGSDTPRQIGFGIAMGLLIGLIPKDSLFVYFFGLCLLISTANLFSAFVSTFVFSWVGFLLDPYAHKIGSFVLTLPSMQSTWVWLSEMPMVPWTRFENTIVTGSLILGLLLFYPVYRISWRFIAKYGPAMNHRLSQYAAYRWFAGNVAIHEDVEAGGQMTESSQMSSEAV